MKLILVIFGISYPLELVKIMRKFEKWIQASLTVLQKMGLSKALFDFVNPLFVLEKIQKIQALPVTWSHISGIFMTKLELIYLTLLNWLTIGFRQSRCQKENSLCVENCSCCVAYLCDNMGIRVLSVNRHLFLKITILKTPRLKILHSPNILNQLYSIPPRADTHCPLTGLHKRECL